MRMTGRKKCAGDGEEPRQVSLHGHGCCEAEAEGKKRVTDSQNAGKAIERGGETVGRISAGSVMGKSKLLRLKLF